MKFILNKMLTSVVVLLILLTFIVPSISQASGNLKVAVAANFIEPFKKISAAFEELTKIKVEGTFASTGSLYSQIINGAPYDIFLSADEERPSVLFEKKLGAKPFIYATGRVVLFSAEKRFCNTGSWQEALQNKKIEKIAMPNTKTAPYGAAAEKALKKIGLWQDAERKLIIAQNVSQAFQYTVTGGTQVGFCALSSALSESGKKGCHYFIDEAPPIKQSACLLNRSTRRNDALLFLKFLDSSAAKKIKKHYGYQ